MLTEFEKVLCVIHGFPCSMCKFKRCPKLANLTRTREALELEHIETLNKLKEAELEITSLHRMFTTSALRGVEEK